MKIAYLTNSRFPSERAHSSQISHMCQAFSEAGVQVTLFSNQRSESGSVMLPGELGFTPKFQVKKVYSAKLFPGLRITFHLSELLFVINFLIKNNISEYDYFYIRSEWLGWFLSFFVSYKRIIWESHEAKLNYPARSLIRRGVKTVVISEGIFNKYLSCGIKSEQMVVAHDGIDGTFFKEAFTKDQARDYLNLPIPGRIIMYIGGFDKWKGVESFFQASTIETALTFVAIGGSEYDISNFKKEYPKANFLGPKPYKELKNLQQAADILVVPNTKKNKLSAKYTSPLKLFAHMASGIPLLVSNIPSLSVVVNEDQVTFFEPDSYKDLIAKADLILENYESKTSSAVKLKDFSRKFTWNSRVKIIVDFINE